MSKVIRVDDDVITMLQVIAEDESLSFTTYNKVLLLVLQRYIDNKENESK